MMIGLFFILLTVAIYWASKKLYRFKPNVLLSPLLITPLMIICILGFGNIPYSTYNTGGQWLGKMIGPATIALAVPMYKNAAMLKKYALEIVAGVSGGWIVGVAAALIVSRMLDLDTSLIDSLLLRSTTTPIAIAITNMIGGISTLTAVFVIVTGIIGSVLGPFMIRAARIRSEVAKGILMGSSAHAAGTHKAFEFGAISGAIASIAMILTAFISLALVPWVLTHF